MKLIAEIGSNHNGSLGRALVLISAARAAGFDGVKFQAFRVREMFHPLALERHPELLERERLEVPDEWWDPLWEEAFRLGLDFGVTPFDFGSLIRVSTMTDFLKVSSYQLLDLRFVSMVGSYVKPLVISTGMATMDEVREAVQCVGTPREDLTLLHCVSLYPCLPEEANLRAIQTLREAFPGEMMGWSDHTASWPVCRSAWRDFGADMMELHFDLDDRLGTEARHSWTPKWIKPLMGPMAEWRTIDGDGTGIKAPQPRELPERLWRHDPSDGMRPLKELRELWLAQDALPSPPTG